MPTRQFLPNTVDVCLINVRNVSPADLARYQTLMDEREQAKTQRFMQADDRLRYTVAHGALRQLLSEYLDNAANELSFTAGPHGKPELKDQACQFNISHSGDYVLIGLSETHPIGVDVEQNKPISDYLKLAQRFFHPEEYKSISALPNDLGLQAFYRCWNRKEAVAKATGQGLQMGFHTFQVSPTETPWVEFDDPGPDNSQWHIEDLDLSPSSHRACVAANADPIHTRLIQI